MAASGMRPGSGFECQSLGALPREMEVPIKLPSLLECLGGNNPAPDWGFNHTPIRLTALGSVSPRSKCLQIRSLLGVLFLLLTVSASGGRDEEMLGVSSVRALTPFVRASPPALISSQRPLPKAVSLGVEMQVMVPARTQHPPYSMQQWLSREAGDPDLGSGSGALHCLSLVHGATAQRSRRWWYWR